MKESFDIPAKRRERKAFRRFLRGTILKDKRPSEISVLSLVGCEAIDVFEVYDRLEIPRRNIVACEIDHSSAELLRIQEVGIEVVECDVTEYLKSTDKRFDVINLDFCGCMNSSVLESIRYVFGRRVLNHNGVLSCTFLARRENKEVKEILKRPLMTSKMGEIGITLLTEHRVPMPKPGFETRDVDMLSEELIDATSGSPIASEQVCELKEISDDTETVFREGIPLNIIGCGIMGKLNIAKIIPDGLINMVLGCDIEGAIGTIDALRHIQDRNLQAELDILQGNVDKVVSDYEKADAALLSQEGMVPTKIESYRYSSDAGSPMLNFIFRMANIETVYKRVGPISWGEYFCRISLGKTLPAVQDIPSPKSEDREDDEMHKKRAEKMGEYTRKKVLAALRAGIGKDKIARIFGVTKMQVSALDAWRTMGKYR
jgi:hypothetical protein